MTSGDSKCRGILNLIGTLRLKIKTIIVTVILIFLIPTVFLTISVPFGLFRYTFHKLTTRTKAGVGKMVSLRGTVFAIDSLYTQPKANVVVRLTLEGNLDLALLKKSVTRNLLEGKLWNGELKYPELRQYLNQRMGYFFWKDDMTFDINRHVGIINSKLSMHSESEIQDIHQQLIHKPWTVKRPLWDMTAVPNCYPKGRDMTSPHTVLFIRYHHTLSDGYSMLRLLSEGLSAKESIPENASPSFSGRNLFKSFLFWLTFPLVGCYEIAEFEVGFRYPVPFTPVPSEQTGTFNVGVTDKIPIKRIKEIKNHFGVGFAAVVYSACAGALRDIMITKGIKVPDQIPCGTILPLPDHPEKLRNFMAIGTLRLSTGESDPVRRLERISKDYEMLKRSAAPVLAGYLPIILGSLPACGIRAIADKAFTASGVTNFPGGFEHMSFGGLKVVDTIAAGGLINRGIGICIFALSYADGLRISPVADDAVMTSEELNQVVRLIEKHVEILHNRIFLDV